MHPYAFQEKKSHWGADYMSQAGSVEGLALSAEMTAQPGYYMRRASLPAAKFRSCRVKRWLHRRA